jgi:hypothetical protein
MKIKLLILFLTCSSYTFGQFKISKVDSAKLPKGIKFSGHLTNSAKWSDTIGIHYVLLTETGEYYSKDKKGNEYKNAELFAYYFMQKGDSTKLIWKIYDYNKNCEFDVNSKFIDRAFKVTDLDKDGIAEVWVMYENQCTSDVSPAPTRIIMYEGKVKYAMRGENKVEVAEKSFIGGEYTFDDNFKTGNSLFQQFGIDLWKNNILYRW